MDFQFDASNYSCIDEEFTKELLQLKANELVAEKSISDAYVAEWELIKYLIGLMEKGFCCSGSFSYFKNPDIEGVKVLSGCGIDSNLVNLAFNELNDDNSTIWIFPILPELAQLITTINEIKDSCDQSEWKVEVEDGLVPRCLWDGSGAIVSGHAGMVDAVWSEMKGVLGLAPAMTKMMEKATRLAVGFLKGAVWCKDFQLSEEDMLALLAKIKAENDANNLNPELKEFYDTYLSVINLGNPGAIAQGIIKAYNEGVIQGLGMDCDEANLIENSVYRAVDLLFEKATWNALADQFIAAVSELWENVNGMEDEEHYYRTYYLSKVALALVPVGGQAKSGAKLSTVMAEKADDVLKKANFVTDYAKLHSQKYWDDLTKKDYFDDIKRKDLLQEDCSKNLTFARMMAKCPTGVKSAKCPIGEVWEKVSIFTTKKKEWIRTNVPLLEKMAKETPEVQDKIVDYYRTFQKPSTSGAPPFTYTTSSGHKVEFDVFAQPRFEPHVPEMKGVGKIAYEPDKLSNLPSANNSTLMGSSGHDIADANRWIEDTYPGKAVKTPGGQVKILIDDNGQDKWITCVWHHHEAGRALIPVPIEIHNRPLGGAAHTGGNSIIDKGLKDFFDPFTGF